MISTRIGSQVLLLLATAMPFAASYLPTVAAAEPTKEQLDFFEGKIRPVLVESCYECHSVKAATQQNLKGGLLLDSREATRRGGESGPAVVPGKPDESLLIAALQHESVEMPPEGKLSEQVIANFVEWVRIGAPDPRDGPALDVRKQIDIEAGRTHWAFQPIRAVVPPKTLQAAESRTPIDQFIRARQAAAGLIPNDSAAPRTLIRRAYFDLIGLPPTPARVEQFVAESATDGNAAYERLIDELLASAHYGERWGRHWLDIARFAESNGYAFDRDRPNAWHYRDFVIRALNDDMPYDEFVRRQVAGDLLTDLNVATKADAHSTIELLAATGFVVAGPFTTQQTQKERERSRYEQLDDMINTLGTSLLGLTVGCCRCHDHKFDPLPIHDYYRLASCFADVGFADTGINVNPETYAKAKAEYDRAHAPLVAARSKHEQQQQPPRFEAWLAELPKTQLVSPAAITQQPWHHVGPFAAADFQTALEQRFEPEQSLEQDQPLDVTTTYAEGKLKWTPQPGWTDGQVHNTLVGDNSANYLYRAIESPDRQSVSLSLGSDDAIKVWLNGKQVLKNAVSRGAAPNQERLDVTLEKGSNELLVKIVNGGGPSGFYYEAQPTVTVELPELGAWHHVGPFPAGNLNAAFDQAFPPEQSVDLSQKFKEGKLHWTNHTDWSDGTAHNDKLPGTNCANYLYRVIEAATPRVLALSLGSDDGIKVWVNGREVLAKKVGRNNAAADQERISIQLAAGRNELLMKITNGGGTSGFYFQASTGHAPDDVAKLLKQEPKTWKPPQRTKVLQWFRGFDLEWLALNQAVTLHSRAEPKPELTPVYAAKVRGTSYQFGADSYKVYQLRRGNADNKEDEAQPGFLQVLMRTDQQEAAWMGAADASTTKARPSRLALAEWLTDVDKGAGPLLARVMVNRLWHHHFGRGIVATPSDFGTRGEQPSHPELLEWLAGELIRGGWKLKPIHKLIMTSGVYMQSVGVSESGQRIDPENLLFWRRDVRRLEAEIVRDALLSVGGRLDSTMHGKGTLDQNHPRRSIYLTVKRGQLIPLLQLFDAPDAMQGVGSREESTVAPQALAMLNSPFVRDMATRFASSMDASASESFDDVILAAYQTALGRSATVNETARMTVFIENQIAAREGAANARQLAVRDFCHLLLCTNEFIYVD